MGGALIGVIFGLLLTAVVIVGVLRLLSLSTGGSSRRRRDVNGDFPFTTFTSDGGINSGDASHDCSHHTTSHDAHPTTAPSDHGVSHTHDGGGGFDGGGHFGGHH